MDSINEMRSNLRRCYDCAETQACLGCPFNGDKLDIIQYLSDLRGNFTDRERELLSIGLLRLMREADKAYGEIDSNAARSAIKAYRSELQSLNTKVLHMDA